MDVQASLEQGHWSLHARVECHFLRESRCKNCLCNAIAVGIKATANMR